MPNPSWFSLISVFSGSFSANNLLATIPVWGPEYQLSFEFSLTSPCGGGETVCSIIVLANNAAGVPATFLEQTELDQQFQLKISVDLGDSASFVKHQEKYLSGS